MPEKAVDHQTKHYLALFDLLEAYDSIPCEALWMEVRKLGVQDALGEIIKSFHSNMKSRVRVDRELLDEIKVNYGLSQGCIMAPKLFNLDAYLVAERWLERIKSVEGAGTHTRE